MVTIHYIIIIMTKIIQNMFFIRMIIFFVKSHSFSKIFVLYAVESVFFIIYYLSIFIIICLTHKIVYWSGYCSSGLRNCLETKCQNIKEICKMKRIYFFITQNILTKNDFRLRRFGLKSLSCTKNITENKK